MTVKLSQPTSSLDQSYFVTVCLEWIRGFKPHVLRLREPLIQGQYVLTDESVEDTGILMDTVAFEKISVINQRKFQKSN